MHIACSAVAHAHAKKTPVVKSKVVFLFGGIFHLGLKVKILTCFQLLSSQYPKPSVRITNKLILTANQLIQLSGLRSSHARLCR